MPNPKINRDAIRQRLQAFELADLFIECGWNYPSSAAPQPFSVKESTFSALPIAELSGYRVFEVTSPSGVIPDAAMQNAVWKQVARHSAENILIFLNSARTASVWLWMRRDLDPEKGKAAKLRPRRHAFMKGYPGDSFIAKLSALVVAIDELDADGNLSITEAHRRVAKALDVERVTREFYTRFDQERLAFIGFIKGITDIADREWYCSVMLNRLMFVYFIQRKGFLDGDEDYLRVRLNRCKKEKGKDQFYSFYRYFLLRLFHEGFGKRKKDRSPELEKLIGNIPYLNGGLFDVHELERPDRYGTEIQIPDKAFERIFDCFGQYEWTLDPERTVKKPGDKEEINPDVLGYIFEKYINQKQMGAYYTKEDITEYISKGTVLPFLLDAARKNCATAFDSTEGPNVWELLRDNPDSYIYPAVGYGTASELPTEVAAEIDATKPNLIDRRKSWNKAAPAEFGLPTETWREVIARRRHHEAVRKKLASGKIRDVNDFLTLNLDLHQFTRDIIQNCEGPDLLMAFWQAVTQITILDPTGGSGAFVFAALNLLEGLYEDCLDRMEGFLAEWGEDGKRLHSQHHKKFTEVLGRIEKHPNQTYFILKSIILQNLYAVDIMEEAVEICKLRLFLKLASQVEPDSDEDNLGIEPLPDIDFNIRAGNTLVGYASKEEVRRCMKELGGGQMKLLGEAELDSFETFNRRCAEVEEEFTKFRQRQTEMDGAVPQADKIELQKRLKVLERELNLNLAREYGVESDDSKAFAKWVKSHQPFHWFVEFYGIINDGGFDVIIGNPPYYDLKQGLPYAIKGYATLPTKNLYPLMLERSIPLTAPSGRIGVIVPISSISTEGYSELQSIILKFPGHFSSFDDRPSRLFDGLEHIQLTIHLLQKLQTTDPRHFVTECYRWSAVERPNLFPTIGFESVDASYLPGCIPKLSTQVEHSILNKIWDDKKSLGTQTFDAGANKVYYSRKVHNFLQVLDFVPKVYDGKGALRPPSELKHLTFSNKDEAVATFCLLNSTLFRWFINVFTDCRHVNKREVEGFRCDLKKLCEPNKKDIRELGSKLSKSLDKTSEFREMKFKHDRLRVQCIIPKHSKAIIDEVDSLLGKHYGFTMEELDFIINYDIKYRMGRDANVEV